MPALVAEDTWQRVQRRLADNKRYATRNSINPSLLQGIAPAAAAATPTTARRHAPPTRNYYYRCLGSDDYRYEHGRVCANKRYAPTTSTASSGTTSATCSPTRP